MQALTIFNGVTLPDGSVSGNPFNYSSVPPYYQGVNGLVDQYDATGVAPKNVRVLTQEGMYYNKTDVDALEAQVETLVAQVGNRGTLTVQTQSGTKTCTAYFVQCDPRSSAQRPKAVRIRMVFHTNEDWV